MIQISREMVVMATVQECLLIAAGLKTTTKNPLEQLLCSCPYLLAPFKEMIFNKSQIHSNVFQHLLYAPSAHTV